MDENKRKTLQGWVEKASNHLEDAKKSLESYRVSDSIQDSQECVELSVKALLVAFGIEYPRDHGWDRKQLAGLAKQIQERGIPSRLKAEHLNNCIPLPRLIVLVNMWSHFYIETKYGFEAGHLAPAQDLFKKEDAEHAIRHADECLWAARRLLNLSADKFATVVGNADEHRQTPPHPSPARKE